MSIAEQSCAQAPNVTILRHDKLSRIICRGEHRSPVLRICCKFRIVGENFLLPNLVVAVGLLLRQANSVRPYTYIVQIWQVQQNTPYRNFDRSTFMAKSSYHDRSQPCLSLGFAAVFLFESLSSQPEIMRYGSVQCLPLVNSH